MVIVREGLVTTTWGSMLRTVVDDREEVVVTRGKANLVALDEYEAMLATADLARDPSDTLRLLAAIDRLENR